MSSSAYVMYRNIVQFDVAFAKSPLFRPVALCTSVCSTAVSL